MKKVAIAAAAMIAVIVLIVIISANGNGSANDMFLRIHIRADDNSTEAQTVKYAVKEAVVEYLTPYLASAESKSEAQRIIESKLSSIEQVADKVLRDNGFDYTSKASVRSEQFPTRTYDGLTLQSGVYDALILELGRGSGNNWWCVVYPPLCFVNGESNGANSIVYRSKLLEIIENFMSKFGE